MPIITYYQTHSILTNKANFEDDQMSANLITIKDYEANGHSGHQKTKPIQTQLKPIYRKGKNERFCVDKEPYDCFNNVTRGFYHPKGCPFAKYQNNVSFAFLC